MLDLDLFGQHRAKTGSSSIKLDRQERGQSRRYIWQIYVDIEL
jgi:hypothetical protein